MSTTTVQESTAHARLRFDVEQELHGLFTRSRATASGYGPELTRLLSLTERQIQGGKLLRPLLLLETHRALQGAHETAPSGLQAYRRRAPEHAEVVRIAAGIEALHAAFLLHDDVIDGDVVRRGQPNLIGELAAPSDTEARPGAARHWAQTGGILAGNLLLSAAHQLFARAALPAHLRIRLLDLLEHTILETTAGEFTDVGLSDGIVIPDLTTVLAMTRQKTASYSFELPLRAAVILADGSAELEARLRAAGSHLGVAYQLQDDLLSAFGDARTHGKDPYSDLREGKQTAIVCFARMSSAWPQLAADFGDPHLSFEGAERLRSGLRDCGAEAFVRGLIQDQLTAFDALLSDGEAGAIPPAVADVLRALIARIDGRQS